MEREGRFSAVGLRQRIMSMSARGKFAKNFLPKLTGRVNSHRRHLKNDKNLLQRRYPNSRENEKKKKLS